MNDVNDKKPCKQNRVPSQVLHSGICVKIMESETVLKKGQFKDILIDMIIK